MMGKIKSFLNKKPTDSPRDEFTCRFRGGLWRPTLRCTVCDSESKRYHVEGVTGPGARLSWYRCPTCETEGLWKFDWWTDRTLLKNLYPDEWSGNPYDTSD